MTVPALGHGSPGVNSPAPAGSSRQQRQVPAHQVRQLVADIIAQQQQGGLMVPLLLDLDPSAYHVKWIPYTAALASYAQHAQAGVLVAEQVLDGWVVAADEFGATVEVTTNNGAVRQHFPREMLRGSFVVSYGQAVRVVAHLLTAPDLEEQADVRMLDNRLGRDTPEPPVADAGGAYELP